MSQPDTIWWCEWYRAPGDQDYCSNVPDAATRHQDCGERLLVSPSALVIERDLDPEFGDEWIWPQEVVHALGHALYGWAEDEPNGATGYNAKMEINEILNALDALAASQKDTETRHPG